MDSLKSKAFIVGTVILAALSLWQMKSVRKADRVSSKTTKPVSENMRAPANTQTPQKPTTATVNPTDKDSLLQALKDTKACYGNEACDFPQTDPKSYEIAVGQKLHGLLKTYRAAYAKDPANLAQTEALAREYIESTDEFVQESALELMTDLPPSEENLKALTESLTNTSDPLLVEQAMNEMKRYMGTSSEYVVHHYLTELLGRGAVFSSEQAVRGLFGFINANSYQTYADLVRTLPVGSSVGRDLRALLEEYRRQQTGG
ncbi:hypothetical protein [Bdellovibrio sp. HCB337]|uniref:hypothetical protein n=1 Tax=Bdellovibrio sp. HCB337 TaxID=3394358 RepID=UPI0039A4E578